MIFTVFAAWTKKDRIKPGRNGSIWRKCLARTLISKATIVSMDPNAGDLQRGDILIDGSQILAVSCSIAAEDAEIIDVSNRPLAVHGVQRVFRTPLRLQRWVDGPKMSRVAVGEVGARSAIEVVAGALQKSVVGDSHATLPMVAPSMICGQKEKAR